MEENNKLFVFDKKEIALIFLFMIVIAITSFTLGVKIGKKMMFATSGVSEQDLNTIKLKSQQEEQIEKVVEETGSKTVDKEELSQDGFNKLQKEMDEIEKGGTPTIQTNQSIKELSSPEKTQAQVQAPSKAQDTLMTSQEDEDKNASGVKFTIQLGSYAKLAEAKEFADAFTIRGYNPIVNQVKVNGKPWYRVSLGNFGSMNEAKEYVKKEESLFQGQEYVIVESK